MKAYTQSATDLYQLWSKDKRSLLIKFLAKFGREFNYGTTEKRNSVKDIKSRINEIGNEEINISFQNVYLTRKEDELKIAKKQKLDILEAEVFWRFFIAPTSNQYNFKNVESNSNFARAELGILLYNVNTTLKRYEILTEIHDTTDNDYLKIVCKIIALPNVVWQELLYRKNIDFQSFESFLRRLKSDQIKAINIAHKEVFEKKVVPTIFSEDKVLRGLFKKIPTYEDIITEIYRFSQKYSSKGSMSYDLFNLDFGYGRYPNGLSDDTEVIERDLSRFISIKNHVNDFVVNKRDGIYWFMYQKARSNYVYKPNKEVELSTHICPGFWYTLMVHLLFWVISPLALIVGLTSVNIEYSFISIMIYGLASFTLTWSIIALLKYIFINGLIPLFKYIGNIDNDFEPPKISKEKIELFGSIAKNVIMTLAVISIIFIMIAVDIIIVSVLSSFLLTYKAVIITIVLNYLAIYLVKTKYLDRSYVPNIKYWPESLKISLYLITAYSVADFIEYSWGAIAQFMYVSIALGIIIIYSLTLLIEFLEKSERSQKYLYKISNYFTYITLAISAGIMLYALTIINPFLVGSVSLIYLVMLYLLSTEINEALIFISPEVRKLERNLNVNAKSISMDFITNTYILSLSDEKQVSVTDKIDELYTWIKNNINSKSLVNIKVYKVLNTQEKVKVFFKTVKLIKAYKKFVDEDDISLVKTYFELIDKGIKKEELLKVMEEKYNPAPKKQKEPKIGKNIKKFYEKLKIEWSKFISLKGVVFIFALSVLLYKTTYQFGEWFITSLIDGITWLPKLIKKYGTQLWSTYKHFQDACPHVAEQRPLK